MLGNVRIGQLRGIGEETTVLTLLEADNSVLASFKNSSEFRRWVCPQISGILVYVDLHRELAEGKGWVKNACLQLGRFFNSRD